jgi:hypothetical protein
MILNAELTGPQHGRREAAFTCCRSGLSDELAFIYRSCLSQSTESLALPLRL